MNLIECPVCENAISSAASQCPNCGHQNATSPFSSPTSVKTKTALLALFLGGLGMHKFYLNKGKVGLLYILFCWTLVPSLIGLIEGITYCFQTDEQFAKLQMLA